ncbi:MAG: adenylate/guanylate cyclase domain-containing protein [Patulibacter minatonensis]
MDRTLLQRLIDPFVDRVVGSRFLIGDPDEAPQRVALRVRAMAITVTALSNAIGAGVVIVFALLVLPKPDGYDQGSSLAVNLGLAGGYTLVALVIGIWWGRARIEDGREGTRQWLLADRAPTDAERARILRGPLRIMVVQLWLWAVATVIFSAVNLFFDPLLALGIGLTVALGGITTSTASYLAAELALRPVIRRALASGDVSRRGVPGVTSRWVLAWALGTAVPVLGLLFIGITALTNAPLDKERLAVTVVVLCGIGLVFGAVVTLLAAYATVHPLASIRRGLGRVEQGDYDVELPVWDSTEVGELQAGFNAMVEGLRERERVRDLFGRQVGTAVAADAIAGGIRLGGELRHVGVLFVDLVGSTALASKTDPEEVVRLLNRFLAVVVECVEATGGFINKFEGDAALAVWGAPAEHDDPASAALEAARMMHERLAVEVDELTAAIGVAFGEAVAGHIGTEARFEYTVIGDPVNEAARLCDLAKQQPDLTLSSGVAVDAASGAEAEHWASDGATVLRGRAQATQLRILAGLRPAGMPNPKSGYATRTASWESACPANPRNGIALSSGAKSPERRLAAVSRRAWDGRAQASGRVQAPGRRAEQVGEGPERCKERLGCARMGPVICT